MKSLKFIILPLLAISLSSCGNGGLFNSNNSSTNNNQNQKSDEIRGLTLIDNVYYKAENDHAEVMLFKDEKNIEIKSKVTINNISYEVKAISNKYFVEKEKTLNVYQQIESLIIPEGITTINSYGLAGLQNLKTLVLPNSLISLKQGALYDSQIEEISLPSFGSDYSYFDGREFDYNSDSHSHFSSDSSNDAKNWYDEHGDNVMNLSRAFSSPYYTYNPDGVGIHECELKIVHITAGEYLFPYSLNLFNLRELYLPSSIIGAFGSAINGYSKLTVNFDSLEQYLSMKYDNLDSALSYLATNINIGGESVKNLVIPEGVKEIQPYAFYNFRDLETISLPSTLVKIGYNAFRSYGSAKASYFNGGFYFGNEENPYLYLAYTSSDISSFTFHPDCQVFSNISFDNSSFYLKEVKFSSNISVVPDYAFYNTPNRTLNSELSKISFIEDNNIEEVGDYAFTRTSLSKVSFSDKIKYIGEHAFGSNHTLTSISWADKVNDLVIKDYAFYFNESFNNEIIIPNGTVEVGDNAFPINLNKESFIYIPSSLVKLPKDCNGHDASIFNVSYSSKMSFVAPKVIFEGSYETQGNIVDMLKEDVSNLTYTYKELVSFANGYLYQEYEESIFFYGFAREWPSFNNVVTIPNEIAGLPVEIVKLSLSDSRLTRGSTLTLNSQCKKIYLTQYTPKKLVSHTALESIDSEGDPSTEYSLFFKGSEEECLISDLPSNVKIYYFSETSNSDGNHWYYSGSYPTIW